MIPTIFADGETDDFAGIVAAYRNEPVELDGKTYQPSETINVANRTITMAHRGIWLILDDEEPPFFPDMMAVFRPDPGRRVDIRNCYFSGENTLGIHPFDAAMWASMPSIHL